MTETTDPRPGLRDARSWNMETSLPLMYSFVHGEELADMADDRDDIMVLTADLATSNRTNDFQHRHPDRFVDLGIAEQNMTSVAAGLASAGFVPYISTFASFAALMCAEQIRTDLAYPQMKVRVLGHHSGISFGFYGTSHHATEDIAITRAIAGLTVVAPSDAASTRALLRATVDEPGPVYVRMGRGREKPIYDSPPEVSRGRFQLVREGVDLTIIATGIGVQGAVGAAGLLAAEGIEVRVLDALWLKPFDVDGVLAAMSETGGILTVEDHNVMGGLGSAVAEVIAESGGSTRFRRHGIQDEYALIGPPTHLWRHYGLDPAGIATRARALLGS
ncbi:MAG: transketolase C-terminal domain-containing protein [Nocardioidaceae bacterium]|nr:transketolase C-terminal domain-containing protein [Nocardioidaceae bacterium]